MHQFNITKTEHLSFVYNGEEFTLQFFPPGNVMRIGCLGVRAVNYFVGSYDGLRKWVDRPILTKDEICRREQIIEAAIKFSEEKGVITKLPVLIR